jgi:hypothetical protein
MNIKLNRKLRQSGLVLWVLIVAVVIFLIVIGTIVTLMIKTIYKLVPPQKKDDGSLAYPGIGARYGGGVVIGYLPGSSQFDYVPIPTNQPVGSFSLLIYAGDCATNVGTTNCIYYTNYANWDDFTNGFGNLTISNLMQLDPEAQAGAPCRFYQTTIQEW